MDMTLRALVFSSLVASLAACGGTASTCTDDTQCLDASGPDATNDDATTASDVTATDANGDVAQDAPAVDAAADAGCTGPNECDDTHPCPTTEKCCATLPNQCSTCFKGSACPP
jgi:hypothetical protein